MYGDTRQDTDMYFTILSEPRRRFTIRFLSDCSPTTLPAITDAITEYEHRGKTAQKSDLRQSVHVSMYQSHILKLDASDIVNYDDQSKDVKIGPKHDRALEIIDYVDTV